MEQVYIDTAKIMKALSDPKRLRIVDMLSRGELCAHNIQSSFDISQPTLSHDMRVLKEAGITNERREGKNIYYTLNSTTLDGFVDSLGKVFTTADTFIVETSDDPSLKTGSSD